MWLECLLVSVVCVVLAVAFYLTINRSKFANKRKFSFVNCLFGGVLAASIVLFVPVHWMGSKQTAWDICRTICLSLFNAFKVLTSGCDFEVIETGVAQCDARDLATIYLAWSAVLYFAAPIFTATAALTLVKNMSANVKYFFAYTKKVYVFSELNEKSLVLASDVRANEENAAIVFANAFAADEKHSSDLLEQAKEIDAICFKKDILGVNFKRHSDKQEIWFFAIGENESSNLDQTLKLIEKYRDRDNTRIYVFSTGMESESLLASADKGNIVVRRVNEVRSLISRQLYEHGELIFNSAREAEDGTKRISAVVVGMGRHGTEMLKALAWFGQMDGYSLTINAFDLDPLAEEKFAAMAPELMSEDYNGVNVPGEAQYLIKVHSGMHVDTLSFANAIGEITDATYVLVALGNDDLNINTAMKLRMYFERKKIHPIIQAIVWDPRQKKALRGLKNFKGQEYDLDLIGDRESSYTTDVIISSVLEQDALERHKGHGSGEDAFWNYEYNYRSSVASAIHLKARIKCGIPGADKPEKALTKEERETIESLEHRRWNAYMRAEGYIYSGDQDPSSRNDLGKMHHDLVNYALLSEEEKRKDSRVGTV